MDLTNKLHTIVCLTAILLLTACSVSYKFNGASIDYSKTKTIQIAEFPIRSSYVWGPMGPMFNNQLKDRFANHTRLEQVRRDGDLKIEGEITQYQQRNKSVSAEGYSAQTELDDRQRALHQQRKPQGRLRAPIYGDSDIRDHTLTELCARRTGDTDGQRPVRADIQCYSGELVIT